MTASAALGCREASRSPRRVCDARECCFEMNARWWDTPGSLSSQNALSDYDRDQILAENPLSSRLPRLNQHVITCDSQDSHLDTPKVPTAEWFAQTKERRPGWRKELEKHERRQSKVALLQRTYVEMICKNQAQARKIIHAVEGFCFYILTRRDASQECSSIFDELSTDALPLTATIFPERKVGKPPVYFSMTHMFRGVGTEDMADVMSRLEASGCSFPDDFCSLWLCTHCFGPLPQGYRCPPEFVAGPAETTETLHEAILHALGEQ
eukprot:TRINITY_DN13929_c0_g1_i1.p1 TRINITY_DN13929_c0_g1~~TRINITY_DN13929_c0_g1_i1.p1  ORF type:complete len:267 (+),score=43.67 TRINITY_DN13929_c0_g1_i1:43-843(+)